MLNLYYLPGACSLVPHVALEWTGAEYQAVEVPRDSLQSPEFLALNPLGQVPVLVDAGQVLSDSKLDTITNPIITKVKTIMNKKRSGGFRFKWQPP